MHDHARDHADEHAHEHAHAGARRELVASLLCGSLLALAAALEALGAPANAALVLDFLALAAGAFFTLQDAVQKVLVGRFEIDFLMIVAAIGAATIGRVAEGALLLFLFSLGHALEAVAMSRARSAITSLAELAPRRAIAVARGETREIPLAEVAPGMRLLVRAHARVPADGVVVQGTSAVDESPVTGESAPVEKSPEERVFAGTLNGDGALEIVATHAASDSTLARVVRMVAEAEARKAPTQRSLERFERVFVPAVIAFDVLLLFAWVVIDEPFSASFYRAMAVLVAASPCALAIAVPSAVLAAVARAARGGVLVKGGLHLGALAKVAAVAFDKTGTLTFGRPRLAEICPAPGVAPSELAAIAIALERGSDHPLARAVIDGLVAHGFTATGAATEVEARVGLGLEAVVGGARARLGKAAMFTPEALLPIRAECDRLGALSQTVVVVEHGGRVLGALGLADLPRPEAARAIADLRALGVGEVVMLTGDNVAVARRIAADVGVDRVETDLMPADKVRAIAALEARHPTLMVGDGVNDAPALATATVGVAMGAAASAVALETADVALMGDDLRGLPFALHLARRARGIIRQNLVASLVVVALLVPLTLFDMLGMGLAVAAHEGVTVLVVLNALRLLAARDPYRPSKLGRYKGLRRSQPI